MSGPELMAIISNGFTRRVTQSRRREVWMLNPFPPSWMIVDYLRGIIDGYSRFRGKSGGAWQV